MSSTSIEKIRCKMCLKRKTIGIEIWPCRRHRTGDGLYKNHAWSFMALLKDRQKTEDKRI